MADTTIIAVNPESADIFLDFANEYPHLIRPVEQKTLIAFAQVTEFILAITPTLLTALSAFLVARVQKSKSDIRIKSGDKEIEIKNTRMTPEEILALLKELEKGS